MSNPIPSSLSLSVISNGTIADATPVASNYAAIQAAVNEFVTALSGGAAGQVLQAVDGTDVQWAYAPGHEIGYNQITSPVGITGLSSASPTSVIAGSAYTFDGSPVIADFYSPEVTSPSLAAGDITVIGLFEGSTLLAEMGFMRCPSAGNAGGATVKGSFRFTPSAGSHTYSVSAWVTNVTGSPSILAGNGTAGAAPAYLRFTKV